MRIQLSKLLIFFLLAIAGCKSPPDPIVRINYYKYFVMLPSDYEQQQSCPLILYLHGRNLVSEDIDTFKSYGLGRYADLHDDFPYVVVAPQTYEDWHPVGLNNVLNEVCENYHIDLNRIYCTGYSMGGHGTYLMAFEYPSRFAAIAPVAGWGIREKACKIKDIPVWIFHNIGDPVIPYALAQEMEQAIIECGGDVRVTTYNDNVHGGRDETYRNPDLYDWFLSHNRDGAK